MDRELHNRVVVTRFSAMGDVVLLLPVLRAVLSHHPNMEIVLVTRHSFTPFFQGIPRLQVHACDFKGRHKGLAGLWRMFLEIWTYRPTHWIDAHDVLRSKILRLLARFWRVPVKKIQKDRWAKRQGTRRYGKIRKKLTPTVDRYLACFQQHGFGPNHLVHSGPFFSIPSREKSTLPKRIGIAPFAQHVAKRWLGYPTLIQHLIENSPDEIWIFGGGIHEKQEVDQWNFPTDRVKNTIGQFTLAEEIGWIQSLDLMIANDSSNLHLATLAGIPTLSIWGATHPDLGFGPWPAQKSEIMQIPVDQLPCRPCSVFGQKKCYRGDYACLTQISAEHVHQKVKTLLS